MKLQLAKGVRDFSPEEMIVRQKVIAKIQEIFEIFGYTQLQTPIIERYDLLTAKFAAGDSSDVVKEIFRLKDQGKRDLGLRFDMTVPLARFVGMNPNLKMPFKRYAIGRVYRDGPIKLGRYREFMQCDADIVGVDSMNAEADLIKMALMVFDELKIDAKILINNRKVLFGIMEFCKVKKDKQIPVITAIDKLKKIGTNGVKKELDKLDVDTKKLLELFSSDIDALKDIDDKNIKQGIAYLDEVMSLIDDKRAIIDISLARGLGYYTGTVFEGFFNDSKIRSSICGGGRYDDMIGNFSGNKFSAVGISFGIEPIIDSIKTTKHKTVTYAYIIPIGKTKKQSYDILDILRKAKIRADIDMIGRGISKNLKYANSLGIPYVIFIGEDELDKGIVKIRNMESGKEQTVKISDIIGYFK